MISDGERAQNRIILQWDYKKESTTNSFVESILLAFMSVPEAEGLFIFDTVLWPRRSHWELEPARIVGVKLQLHNNLRQSGH